MKKLLLGTAALVLLAGAASAQQVATKAPFTVTLGGSVRYDFGFFDQDVTGVNREARIDTRLLLNAEAKADNGLTYGYTGRIRTNAPGGNGNGLILDYNYVYASGTWGQVMLGDHAGAATQLEVITPTVGIGQADLAPFLNAGNASMYWATEDTPNTRVTYLTPSFSGFQAGISYVAERDNGRVITLPVKGSTTPVVRDVIELAASYTGEFNGVGVKVGGGYEFAGSHNRAPDYRIYNLGAVVSYSGFSFGGNYLNNGESLQSRGDNQYGWALGLTYEADSYGLGVSYNQVRTDLAGPGGRTLDQVWGIGGAYRLAPGLSLQADLNVVDADTVRNQGVGVVFRTRVDF